jgi:hypothetical protein
MGGACSMHGVVRNMYRIFIGKYVGEKDLVLLIVVIKN